MAEKKFGVRDLEIIDPTGTPTIESSGDLIVNAGGATERLRVTSGGNVQIANGNLVFSTSGTGIDFSANSNAAGMTSELLDDYEEGTWTPTLTTTGTDFTSVTYAGANGRYTKIGNTVCAWFSMYTNSITVGSASGNVVLSGLPFSVNNATLADRSAGPLSNVSGWSSGNMPDVVGNISGGASLYIWKRPSAGGAQTTLGVSDVGTGVNSNSMHGVFVYNT